MAVTVAEVEQFIRAAPEGKTSRLNVADRLFLEVRRPGAAAPKASFVLRYSHAGKKQSLGLGVYTSPAWAGGVAGVTLAKARSKAAEELKQIDAGVQPVKTRKERAKKETADRDAAAAVESRTVRLAVELWHEATKDKLTSDKYRDQRLRRVSEYFPHIGTIAVERLTVADVAGAFTELKRADKVTGRRANRAETLKRSSADLGKSLEYAAALGWFTGANPVTRARGGLPNPKKVGYRTIPVDKLTAFVMDVAAAGASKPYPVAEHLLRLLVLTAARTSEIRLLKWSEVEGLEGDKPVLNIPAERMKKRLAWSIPLCAQAVDILRDLRGWQAQVGGGLKGVADGFVFTRLERNYKGRVCSENAVNDLLQGMGWGSELVGHGLRKVFSTVAHDCWPYHGANRTEAIEFSMAHVHKDAVRGTYDLNDFMALRRNVMNWWSEHLAVLRQPQTGNVVALRSAA